MFMFMYKLSELSFSTHHPPPPLFTFIDRSLKQQKNVHKLKVYDPLCPVFVYKSAKHRLFLTSSYCTYILALCGQHTHTDTHFMILAKV